MGLSPESLIPGIISHYGLSAGNFSIERLGSGHIHYTYKLNAKKSYVLQRVNKNVFKEPEVIASNLRVAADYLGKNFTDFLFLSAIETLEGKEMVYDAEGFPWRLFPFFDNTFTVDKVSTKEEAFSAAAEFARLSRYLKDVDTSRFSPTIPGFHDLSLRYRQFETALKNATPERIQRAQEAIAQAKAFSHLVTEYETLISSGSLKLRITHNDTKINNVLFNANTGKALCAIDLDTLMPGYFIYDIGDMIRTFVSPVDEEEKDVSKITVRQDIYRALVDGYLSQMNDCLTPEEKKAIPFSGMMMTYIMALRMLADFLNGDIYYHIKYEGQNLVRATNQLRLLQELKTVNGNQ
ncbi:phosphotransferase [Fulvivirgaceae bacterium PWU4]|uniref:Phosphotransferase n=1 Tax=Chryseosolibacter histidini TaxID=2782349 RepID=A0AAP2GME6_9BACT|nr:aminoglycoside phosphotransferase family protein [Chryseosolibacter histidini]MBT1701169.1 phosphotransferase [Chryseosolibacter histidini]